MWIEVDGEERRQASSDHDVRVAVNSLNRVGSFVILSSGDENYIQAAIDDDGWIIEKRKGSFDLHMSGLAGDRKRLTTGEVEDAFVTYFRGSQSPDVRWVKVGQVDPKSFTGKAIGATRRFVWPALSILIILLLLLRWYLRQ